MQLPKSTTTIKKEDIKMEMSTTKTITIKVST